MSEKVTMELKRISQLHDGLLRPDNVVESARDPQSLLHSWFEWDDGKAAQEHRLNQARGLIRMNITYLSDANRTVPYRVFVSLPSDRIAGNGYRETAIVLGDPILREEMLAEAIRRLRSLQIQYRDLRELQEVFESIEKVAAQAV